MVKKTRKRVPTKIVRVKKKMRLTMTMMTMLMKVM